MLRAHPQHRILLRESGVNWQFNDTVEYRTGPTSIIVIVRAAPGDPYVTGETYAVTRDTITGKARDMFAP